MADLLPYVIALVLLVVAVVVWTQRHRVSHIGLTIRDWIKLDIELNREKREQALPESGERVFSKEDLRGALEVIPGIPSDKLLEAFPFSDDRTHLDFAYDFMRRTGVVTKKQLDELTGSEEIRDALSKIYIDELKRPQSHPLDPVAIATWGSYLYLYGVTDKTLDAVRRAVRRFPEYVQVKRVQLPGSYM